MQNEQILRLLVIDGKSAIDQIAQLLQGSDLQVKLTFTLTLQEGLTFLEDADVDLVLMGLELPDSFGVEAFIQVYEYDVPIVVMTDRDNEELGIQVLRKGAQDHLIRNGVLTARGLRRVILHAIERSAFTSSAGLDSIKDTNGMGVCPHNEIHKARQALRESTQRMKDTYTQFGALNGTEKVIIQRAGHQ